jgi:hypothetical protein
VLQICADQKSLVQPSLPHRVAQTIKRIACHHKPQLYPCRVHQRITHRMQPEQPYSFIRSLPFGLFFRDDPLGFLHDLAPLGAALWRIKFRPDLA